MVCVSTCETPSILLSFSRNSLSGGWPASSHGPKVSSGTVTPNLKSRQPPQTFRLTTAPSSALSLGRYSSTRSAISTSVLDDAFPPPSSSHLQRHSRLTLPKLILPFAI